MGASMSCVAYDRKCDDEEFEGGLPAFDREWWAGVLQGRGASSVLHHQDSERWSGSRPDLASTVRMPTLLMISADNFKQSTSACKSDPCSIKIAVLQDCNHGDPDAEGSAATCFDHVKGTEATEEHGQVGAHSGRLVEASCDAEAERKRCDHCESHTEPGETFVDQAKAESRGVGGNARCEATVHACFLKRAQMTPQTGPSEGRGVADVILVSARKPEWDSVRGKSKVEIEKVLGLGVVAERLRAAANAEKDRPHSKTNPTSRSHRLTTLAASVA